VLAVRSPSAEERLPIKLSRFPKPFNRDRKVDVVVVAPEPIVAVDGKPLRGEGEWTAIGSTVNDKPPLYATYFRPEPECADVTVAAARFDQKLARFVLVPGTHDPGDDFRWHGVVPDDQRGTLIAAFNTGYRLRDAKGGIFVEGKEARPLVEGAASLTVDKSGQIDVMAWKGPSALTADVVAVRQNLKMLIEDGRIKNPSSKKCVKGIDRSGLGVTKDGALIYVIGHRLTPIVLSEALKHLGAVRAMQLDAHIQWQSFNVFQPVNEGSKELVATKLTQDMRQPATRYLVPDDRDFLAAFVR
jgi:hypothetical protein